MTELNPYAPPSIIAEPALPPGKYPSDDGGLWRQGNLLVMRKDAQLPPRCVKSNQPVERFLQRRLVWLPSWIYVLLIISAPIFAIPFLVVALLVQKKATIYIGLSDKWFARRRMRLPIAWAIGLLAALTFLGGMALFSTVDIASSPSLEQSIEQMKLGVVVQVTSLLVLLGAMTYGFLAARTVHAKKIDDHFVWLKGVCPEYLADLPEWTGPKA